MSRWIALALFAVVLGVALLFVLRPGAEDVATGDPETRIIGYLKKNVRPGQSVLVTDLYNNVFTSNEEREALQRLYDAFFKIPATAAQIYIDRKSTRLNSSHEWISYAVFCLKK